MIAVVDGVSRSGKSTLPRAILPLSTLNALTCTGQKVAAGAYSAARDYADFSRDPMDRPERRERYRLTAIRWQEDAAEFSARQRAAYLADNAP